MPISVKCQFCGKLVKVKDQLAGKKIKCSDCGSHVEVPGAEDEDEFTAAKPSKSAKPRRRSSDDEDEFDEAPRRRGSAKSGNPALLIGVVIGCVALLMSCIIAPIVYFSMRTAPPPNPVAQNNPQDQQNKPFDQNNFQPKFPQQQQPQANPAQNNPGGFNNPPAGFQPGQGAQADNGGANNPNAAAAENPGGFNKPAAGPVAQGANWSAKADPPAQPPAVVELKKPLSVPVSDSWEGPLFTINNSPFAAVGSNGDERSVREFWNLATGKKIGSLKGVKLDNDQRGLSDDGKYFAAKVAWKDTLMVWDIKASKDMGTLKIGPWAKWVGFAGSKRVMVMADKKISCWKLPSGDFERALDIDVWDDKGLATSPGGNYLASASAAGGSHSIVLFDLESGKHAGEITLPSGFHDVRGVAFSPDGSELAALLTRGSDMLLMVWTMADGQNSASIEINDQNDLFHKWHQYKGRHLVWFPDQKRWLVSGQSIISRDSSSIVWTFPDVEFGNERFVSVLDDTHLAVVFKEFAKGGKLATVELTKEKMDEAQKIVAQGGTAADAGLPPLTKSDIAAAKRLLVGGGAGAWTVKPDPAPVAKGKLLTQSLVLKSRTATLESAALSAADSARFVAQYSASNKSQGIKNNGKGKDDAPASPVFLDVYDIAAGKFTASTPIPFESTLMSVSPDGKRALLRLGGKKDRLDVVEVDGGKPVCAFRPYMDEKNQNEREIKAALFVDDSHVLTLNGGFPGFGGGAIVMWELPSCKAIYMMDKADGPGISAGRKYVVAANSEMYRFFDALTGESAGAIELPGQVQAAAFHAGGESFGAVVNDAGGNSTLMIWKMADGSLEHEIPLGTPARSLKFNGKLNVLINNSDLIDIPSKCPAWKYVVGGNVQEILFVPDSRNWYVAQRQRGEITLSAVELPHEEASRAILAANLRPDYVIQPGTPVSLNVTVTAPPGKPNFAALVTDNFTKRLQANGAVVQPGSDVVIEVQSGSPVATGEKREYNIIGVGGGNSTVNVQKISYSVTIKRGGTAAWTRSGEVSNDAYFVHIPQGKQIGDHLNEQMWNNLQGAVSGQSLPKFVLSDESSKGLGTSFFTAEGVQRKAN